MQDTPMLSLLALYLLRDIKPSLDEIPNSLSFPFMRVSLINACINCMTAVQTTWSTLCSGFCCLNLWMPGLSCMAVARTQDTPVTQPATRLKAPVR